MHFRVFSSKWFIFMKFLDCGCVASIFMNFTYVEHSLYDSAQQTFAIIQDGKS